MTSYLLCDFETRSLAPLKAVGGRVYAGHSSTEVLCVAFAEGDEEPVALWRPRRYPFGSERVDVAVAHNADGFDRFIWEVTLGWPPPRRWLDTAALCRRAGFASSALAEVGERYGFPKDKEGNKLTVGLSRRARKGGGFHVPFIPADVAARVMSYCCTDVGVMRCAFDDLVTEFDFALYPPGTWQHAENLVYEVDRAVQDRGAPFDRAFAQALRRCEVIAADAACKAAGVTAAQVRSAAQFKALYEAATGVSLPNVQRATLAALPPHPLVTARLACTSITVGKIDAGLQRLTGGGRLRDTTKYCGAHTWRWSGQGMQCHNLPRGEALPAGIYEAVLRAGS